MSTPYVGLKQLHQSTRFSGTTPWASDTEPVTPQGMGDYRREVKRRLLHILASELGVESLHVGAFQMKLTEAVPEQYLMKASHYLMDQYRLDPEGEHYAALLEDCLRALRR